MLTIKEYPISLSVESTIMVPKFAEFMRVGVVGYDPKVWYLVNDKRPKETVKFRVYRTDDEIPLMGHLTYVDTFSLPGDDPTYHLFQVS